MNSSPPLHGLDGLGLYAPADFADADDLRPTAAIFDMTGNGSSTPYTSAVNGLINKHLDELKQKTAVAVSLPVGWKKRLREFLSKKNTELLDFLSLSTASHPTLSKGDLLMRKFGASHVQPNHASVRDYMLDVSGENIVATITEQLEALRKGDALKDYLASVRHIFEQYREAGDRALEAEAELKAKLDTLDKVQGRLSGVLDLSPNQSYQPLMEATEAYLEELYKSHQIEESYTRLIAAYRRFIALRDVVLMTRTIQSNENEPLCTICLNEPVSFTLTPCGHTFCGTCVRRQIGTCFVCRGPFREKVKLFFG